MHQYGGNNTQFLARFQTLSLLSESVATTGRSSLETSVLAALASVQASQTVSFVYKARYINHPPWAAIVKALLGSVNLREQ